MTYPIEALSNLTQFFRTSGQFYGGQAHSIPNQIIQIFSKSKFIYAFHINKKVWFFVIND